MIHNSGNNRGYEDIASQKSVPSNDPLKMAKRCFMSIHFIRYRQHYIIQTEV